MGSSPASTIMEIRKHRYPDHFFVRSSYLPLQRLTRPLKMIFINPNGWVTIVCKWSTDRDYIIKELTGD